MSARVLSAGVLRALRELRVMVTADADLTTLAWASAVEVEREPLQWGSTMELAAARSFCLALLAGDLDRAARCAVWIFAPGEAFRTAQAELNAGAAS